MSFRLPHAWIPVFLLAGLLTVSACDSTGPDDTLIDTPDTYTFSRDGVSTVSYTGQVDRLDMVAEMKSYLQQGDAGQVITSAALMDMYTNAGGDGGGKFSFDSDRQLRNKTFAPDLDAELFEGIFEDAAAASIAGNAGTVASDGTAGLLVRENNGNTILVDERGREFTQLVEKGLMGAVFYHQIYNVYLTEARIGNQVENDETEPEGYTPMEHHWDEAFGYFGAPVDFTSDWPTSRSSEARFWAKYSNVADDELNTNDAIMDAFIEGRAAIVNKEYDLRDAQRDVLYEQLDLVAAATAVHYINSTLQYLNAGQTGEAFHALSEAWAFVNALRYTPRRVLSLPAIDTIMTSDFGENGNFWRVTPAGLNQAKATIVGAYPDLAPYQDDL